MKKILVSILILLFAAMITPQAYAAEPIRIVVNGKELTPDVAPQRIDGRTMAPIRFIAEALGLEVKWDEKYNAIIMTAPGNDSTLQGWDIGNPLPVGKSLITPEGLEISIVNYLEDEEAWKIINEVSQFNKPPDFQYKYALVTIKVKNVSYKRESVWIEDHFFSLIGNRGKEYRTGDRLILLQESGPLKNLTGAIIPYGGEITTTLHFYVLGAEDNLTLAWKKSGLQENRRFLKVNQNFNK